MTNITVSGNIVLFDNKTHPRIICVTHISNKLEFSNAYTGDKILTLNLSEVQIYGKSVGDFANEEAFVKAIAEKVFKKGGGDGNGVAELPTTLVYSDTSQVANSSKVTNIVKVTQVVYDAIAVKDANTLYLIEEST